MGPCGGARKARSFQAGLPDQTQQRRTPQHGRRTGGRARRLGSTDGVLDRRACSTPRRGRGGPSGPRCSRPPCRNLTWSSAYKKDKSWARSHEKPNMRSASRSKPTTAKTVCSARPTSFRRTATDPWGGGGLAVRLTHSERAAPRGARPHGAQLMGLLRADKAVRCPGVEEAFDPTASQRVWRSIRGCGGARRCSPSRLRRR